MDLGISGRVALVTASSRGLGYAVAEDLAREGVRVAVCSRHRDSAEAAAERIGAATRGEVFGFAADVTKDAEIRAAVKRVLDRFSALHILVVNAGGPPAATFDDLEDADFVRTFDLTLQSAVRLARAAVPHMRAQGWGRIVNIVSTAPKQPVDGLMLSNSLRAAVLGFAKTLATEIAPHGITVNSVLPGRIATDRLRELDVARARKTGRTEDEVRRDMESTIPIGRYGRPDEFSAAVAFLCSDTARYITGTALQVDGGLTRGLY